MLVLTRKDHEKLYIGDNIVLQVIEAKNGRVRLAIDAPRGVQIWREEIRPKPATTSGVIAHDKPA